MSQCASGSQRTPSERSLLLPCDPGDGMGWDDGIAWHEMGCRLADRVASVLMCSVMYVSGPAVFLVTVRLFLQIASCCVAQTAFELLGSCDPLHPASERWDVGIYHPFRQNPCVI